jgi:3-methyladenine DNA glycosylase AlkD
VGLSQTASYIKAIDAALKLLSDPARAVKMAAYMKGHFPFLGIPAPVRKAAVKPIPKPKPADVAAIARALWRCQEREYQYVAVDLLDVMAKKLDAPATFALIEELALQKSWWDSVDGLAAIGSSILRRAPAERDIVKAWSAHPSFWVNRLAILHQKGWGADTDETVLFDLCLAHVSNKEFFIRKAIGWALRDYAWTNPAAVQAFVDENRTKLSPLSQREALKNVAGKNVAGKNVAAPATSPSAQGRR